MELSDVATHFSAHQMARWWGEYMANIKSVLGVAVAIALAAGGCAARTTQARGTGRITVGVTSSGTAAAGQTFRLTIEPAGASTQISADAGVFSFPDAPAGDHLVRLGDVPTGCTVDDGPERTVRVIVGRSTTVRFNVQCRSE
jgi:hypothetical protein